ncbi:uncharacterized protein EI90DRAFT_151211 [Cantharellus anzutake]|uniref:uncharacterized protein n=1 Tax=Cantharellus anzutake TaxID=1750568 RepID=UPI0019073B96|nr:uncharacterized protein EI90DRAFT_151211 [Cantharellus anzutake]KAF8336253.1 hypothetical protein EI90DRAFT_151211 [Cantharellus anzutake]
MRRGLCRPWGSIDSISSIIHILLNTLWVNFHFTHPPVSSIHRPSAPRILYLTLRRKVTGINFIDSKSLMRSSHFFHFLCAVIYIVREESMRNGNSIPGAMFSFVLHLLCLTRLEPQCLYEARLIDRFRRNQKQNSSYKETSAHKTHAITHNGVIPVSLQCCKNGKTPRKWPRQRNSSCTMQYFTELADRLLNIKKMEIAWESHTQCSSP